MLPAWCKACKAMGFQELLAKVLIFLVAIIFGLFTCIMFCDQADLANVDDVADVVTSVYVTWWTGNQLHGQASNIASNTTGAAAQGFPHFQDLSGGIGIGESMWKWNKVKMNKYSTGSKKNSVVWRMQVWRHFCCKHLQALWWELALWQVLTWWRAKTKKLCSDPGGNPCRTGSQHCTSESDAITTT